MPLNLYHAADLMSMIAKAGLPVPDQRDVTAQDCPVIGCTDKIDSATVSVSTFPTTGAAETYAGSIHHEFLITNVVMEFGPTLSPDRQHAYEAVVARTVE